MSLFEEFSTNGIQTWQDLFGKVLKDHLDPQGFRVFSNRPQRAEATASVEQEDFRNFTWFEGQMQQRHREILVRRNQSKMPTDIHAILIERGNVPQHPRLPDGLDFLRNNNIMVFEGDVLEMGHLHRLAAFAHDYANFRGIANAHQDLGLLAASPRFDSEVRQQLRPRELLPGVYEYTVERAPKLFIVSTREVMDIPENLLWKLFSFDPPKVRDALDNYKVNDRQNQSIVDAVHDRMLAERLLR